MKNLPNQESALSTESDLLDGREFGHCILFTDKSQVLGIVLAE